MTHGMDRVVEMLRDIVKASDVPEGCVECLPENALAFVAATAKAALELVGAAAVADRTPEPSIFDCKVSQYQLSRMRHFLLLVGPSLAEGNPEAQRLLDEILADARQEDEANAAYLAEMSRRFGTA